ncbi:hypothetical protein SHIRM173S_02943 [Streptomyces hirsutus]
MNDSTATLPWLVVRQDDNGNRYRVGRYATRAEAQRIADSLDGRGHKAVLGRAHRAERDPRRLISHGPARARGGVRVPRRVGCRVRSCRVRDGDARTAPVVVRAGRAVRRR